MFGFGPVELFISILIPILVILIPILGFIFIFYFVFKLITAPKVSKSIATDEKEPTEKRSPKQAQEMYDNGECPECAVRIGENSVRCQSCNENLFEYAQRAFKAKK